MMVYGLISDPAALLTAFGGVGIGALVYRFAIKPQAKCGVFLALLNSVWCRRPRFCLCPFAFSRRLGVSCE
jgi:hypothetical protein